MPGGLSSNRGTATNVTAATDGTGGSSSASGTITTGGTAQVLFSGANGVRGYLFQNQSAGPLYIRSRGSAGTLAATQDQNSFRVDAGAVYEPHQVSDYGYSIVGATTGQAYHCLWW